jgi:hypothetical protein
MKWRVVLELVGPDGTVVVHEIGGRAAVAEYALQMIGLTLADGKQVLAGLQVHLVRAQAEDHCRRRRRCQRCDAQRPLKDRRSRQLVSLFGTVEVRAPRFTPCRCAVTCRRTLNPIAEIMPDRCTPEYERTIAKMGSLLPYRRARTLLAEFLPLGKPQAVETTRQRILRVGTRLEQEAVAGAGSKSVVGAKSIALSIDGGHLRAEATSQTRQLRGVLHGVGATPATPVTILSDGADGPRSLGEAASPVRLIMCSTASTSRCGFSTSHRRPRAGPIRRREIARLVLALPRRLSGSDGVSGMVRSNGLWILLPKPSLQ